MLTIDYMRKVSESQVTQMIESLREEAELLMLQAAEEKPPSTLAPPQEAKRHATKRTHYAVSQIVCA